MSILQIITPTGRNHQNILSISKIVHNTDLHSKKATRRWPFLLFIWFFHGHAPGKNTLTREHRRNDAAKPARTPELNWDLKTNEVFSNPDYFSLG